MNATNGKSAPEPDSNKELRTVLNRRKAIEEPARLQRRLEDSRDRLQTIYERRLRTLFIGNIALIEKYFGHLWGHNKPKSERTEQEARWNNHWQKLRSEILDKGNDQVRDVEVELDNYDINYHGTRAVLPVIHDPVE